MFSGRFQVPTGVLVLLLKLRSSESQFYTRRTFALLQESFAKMTPGPQVSIWGPSPSLAEQPVKLVSPWMAALFWMFNADDLTPPGALYAAADKEIAELCAKLKKDAQKAK